MKAQNNGEPGDLPAPHHPGSIESFSTNTLVKRGRARAWNEIYSSRLATADFIPRHGNFTAGLEHGGIGQIELVRLTTGPCTIRRTEDHIGERHDERIYSFMIQLHGKGRFSQGGHEAILQRGDVSFCDNGVPHCNDLGGDAEMLLVRVPDDIMQHYIPYPETLRGRPLSAHEGVAPIATAMACSLWKQVERGLDAAHADSVAHQLLDLLITSYSQVYGPEMSGPFPDALTHARALDFIEEMITDPRLNARRAAKAADVTLGELLAMFLRRGDSFSGYVTRRRLDRAARNLRNPRWRGSTISEVAYGVGYNSVPLFTRNFRARFGLSPGDCRRAGLN